MLKIHLKKKYQFFINTNEMILKLSLNTQVMWKIFMKILMNTIQINTAKY